MSQSFRASRSIAAILPAARPRDSPRRPPWNARERVVPIKRLLLLVLAVAGLYVLVDHLIVTDKERVERVVRDVRDAVVRNDWAAVASFVDEDVTLGARDKASLVESWRSMWRASALSTIDADVSDVAVEGDRAAARVRVGPGGIVARSWGDGLVHFVRRDDGWKISGVDDVHYGGGIR